MGDSSRMKQLRDLVRQVAPTDATVLISGETGTGKEVLARYIYATSARAARPFVAVNCAALPESLIESELFGHTRGAFTGASHAREGYFEAADHGTLFLDEITEVSPHIQAKLLRVLQEREIRRVGSTQVRSVNVRIIAASSRDLKCARATGALREDLYYRLRMVELHLPPLRERREDVQQLGEYFLQIYGPRNGSSLRSISAAALELMQAYDWPGNVRELESVIGRATVIVPRSGRDVLLPSDLPDEVRGESSPATAAQEDAALHLDGAVSQLKQKYLAEALRRARGNKAEAARLLGISRRGLYNLLGDAGS